MREPLDIEDYLNGKGCFVDKNGRSTRLGTVGSLMITSKVFEAMDAADFTYKEWVRFINYAESYGMTNDMFTLVAATVKVHLSGLKDKLCRKM